MHKIPKDVAERVYEQYEITLQDPMPFEEMFTSCGDGMFEFSEQHKHAYERGIVEPAGQIFWIHSLHKKVSDSREPYDIGVLNTLELISHITTGKDPVFTEKPETAKKLREKISTGGKELGVAKRALAAAKRTLAERVKELSRALNTNTQKTSKSSKKR